MKKLFILPVICVVVLLLFAIQAHAAPLDSAGMLDKILSEFADAAKKWEEKIISYASWLFWSLALLSMVWTFGMLVLKNAGISEALAEIVRYFAVTGIYWWLLLNGPKISISITNSMREISRQALGLSETLSPSRIIDIGFDIASKTIDHSSRWSPVNSGIGIIVACIILIMLALVSVNMLLLLISCWILAYGGVFLLGFGGGRWTSDIAFNFYRTVLGVSIQVFAMTLLVGIGKSFIDQYYIAIQDGNMSLKGLLVMLVASLILLMLVNKIPPMLASIVGGGGSTMGIGSFGAGAAFGAAATAAAAAAAAGAATAAGMASLAGGASALKAAFQQAQQHMAEGSGMFSGSFGGGRESGAGSSSSGGSAGFVSAMGTAGKFAADMGANLAKGAGAVAKETGANMLDAMKDRIGQTTGGRVASEIRNLDSTAQEARDFVAESAQHSNSDDFAGDSLGAGKDGSQSALMNEEVANFVNKDQHESA